MKKMIKNILVCGMLIIGLLSLCGCGEKMPYEGLNLSEYVKVGAYKGLKTEKVSVTVTREEIGDKIVEALKAAAEEQKLSKGTAIEDGDVVNIDYVGKKDGKKFDGGSAEGYELEIGSGSFINGFEEGLVGKKVGQKNIKLNLTFPEDYSAAELAGQDVVFTVNINSATRMVQPEFDLDFVKTQGDYDSTEAYEKAIEESIYKEKEREALNSQKTQLWNEVLKGSKIKKYPEDMIEHYTEAFDEQIDYYAEQYGVSRETMLEQYYGTTDEDNVATMLDEYVKALIKQEMLVEYIAQKEGITYTDKEAEEMWQDFESRGYTEESVEMETGRTVDQYIHIALLYEKVLNFILDVAKVK